MVNALKKLRARQMKRLVFRTQKAEKKVTPCASEILNFINALKVHQFDDTKCHDEIRALQFCHDSQEAVPKRKSTLAFHLQKAMRAAESSNTKL